MADVKFGTPYLDDIPFVGRLRTLAVIVNSAGDGSIDIGQLTYFLDQGVSPDLKWPETPLIVIAASGGNANAVDLLLERGADPNLLDEYGDSAITAAVRRGHDDIARRLFEAGADPTLGNESARDLGFKE